MCCRRGVVTGEARRQFRIRALDEREGRVGELNSLDAVHRLAHQLIVAAVGVALDLCAALAHLDVDDGVAGAILFPAGVGEAAELKLLGDALMLVAELVGVVATAGREPEAHEHHTDADNDLLERVGGHSRLLS